MACIAVDPMEIIRALKVMLEMQSSDRMAWVAALENWRVSGLVFNVS